VKSSAGNNREKGLGKQVSFESLKLGGLH